MSFVFLTEQKVGSSLALSQEILPEGWVQKMSSKGQVYYWNKDTNQKQWDHPAGSQLAREVTSLENPWSVPALPPMPAHTQHGFADSLSSGLAMTQTMPSGSGGSEAFSLPDGWVQKMSSKGKVYYWNKSTNEKKWEWPVGEAPQVALALEAPQEVRVDMQALEAALPEGWEAKISRTTGRPYYWNPTTGMTQSQFPQENLSINRAACQLFV